MFFDASHESSDASTNFHHRQQKAVLHNREKLVDILAELLGTIAARHVAYVTALTDHCLLKHAVSPHGCAQP